MVAAALDLGKFMKIVAFFSLLLLPFRVSLEEFGSEKNEKHPLSLRMSFVAIYTLGPSFRRSRSAHSGLERAVRRIIIRTFV